MMAITVKDQRKPAACAMKPINGGPSKKPRKPTVESAASAAPGDMVVDFPAIPKVNGTTEETPMPTNKKPMVAGNR